ncbi:MAG: AMP-binding protein, partial [Planctomycetota bacterium]|nr:AMP-binding protein [Planctomycetota bacterium]
MSNLGQLLRDRAAQFPEKPAVILCRGPGRWGSLRTVRHTFGELERDSDAVGRGLAALGLGGGTRVLVMLRPSLDFFSCFFALLKIGAVPVLIDPGMGARRLLECVRELAPEALIGIPAAHLVRLLFPGSFPGLGTAITVGRRWLWGGHSWSRLRRPAASPLPLARTGGDDLAAILFTTGSTGPAKGVEYSHSALTRQVEILSRTFGIVPGDRDAATFPGFSLFSIALGMTAVVPDLDPTRPGRAYPPNVAAAVRELACTFSFGSPALWSRVSSWAEAGKIRLPSLRRVVMAGAPIPAGVHARLLGGILPPSGETFAPYGATEVMPVACFTGRETLAETAALTREGRGVCLGRPVPGVRVGIIIVDDGPIPEWSDSLLLPAGEIGEIAVRAEHASRRYHRLPAADAGAKILQGESFWHRMGDLGYLDDRGRLWFCGRKSQRVRTRAGDLHTVRCEAIFNRHPEVARSALVGIPEVDGFARAAIVIEPVRKIPAGRRRGLADELFRLGRSSPLGEGIGLLFFHPGFPTDIRHNAKIRREELAAWAAAGRGT